MGTGTAAIIRIIESSGEFMNDSKAYITTPQFPFHVESIHGAKAFPFGAPNHGDGEILFAAEIQIEYRFISYLTLSWLCW